MPKIVASKNDWILLGYKLFSEQGENGIVVEKMASKLKVNKSSFYWHFNSKKEFINDLINYWIKTETEQIIHETDASKDIKEKFNTFLKITFKKAPYLEFIYFLKRYAKKEKEIQIIVDMVDNRRLKYTSLLFQEIGYSKSESIIKARIFYNYLIGYHEMIKNKVQPKNYLSQVKKDLNHFLKF